MASVKVKICGLRTLEHVQAALDADADYIGFVFFEKSPRYLTPHEAKPLRKLLHNSVKAVALVVDANDALLNTIQEVVNPDYFQLHGNETPERVSEIKTKFNIHVIKAIGVSTASDLANVSAYDKVADILMFDAKPPKGAELPGGNAKVFDWNILKGLKISKPWFLAGGLTAQNVHEAIVLTHAPMVDVSSGVENVHKVKDSGLIRAFIHEAKRL